KDVNIAVGAVRDDLLVVYDRDARESDTFQPEMERIAQAISLAADSALLVRYDGRVGYRASQLFQRGRPVREFSLADERWIPYGPDGMPDVNGPTYAADELDPDREYDTAHDAIQLGLEAFGSGTWDELEEFIAGH